MKTILSVWAIIILFALSGSACLIAPSGMVGFWPGDGVANDLIGGNNGILRGTAAATAAGKVGSAFGFDGTNGYVEIPDSSVFHPTNFTVEAWVWFDSLTSAGTADPGEQYIIFKQNTRGSSFEGFALEKVINASSQNVFHFAVIGAAGPPSAKVDSISLVSTGVWYHVAAVRGSNYIELYVNGALEAQASVSFRQDYGTLPLYFGTTGQAYDGKFKGRLDEVSLYNRPLSSNEIASVYLAGVGGKCRQVTPTLFGWGSSFGGVINPPSDLTNVVSVAAGYSHSLALKNDGTVAGWGRVDAGTNLPPRLSNVVAIAAGGYHGLALNRRGTVVAWGHNGQGQTNVPSGLSGVMAIAGGGEHSLSLKSNGTVVAWGHNGQGQTNVPSGLSSVMAIAGGGYHSLALKSNGTVVAWGSNDQGQTNVPVGLSSVIAIAGGRFHSLALRSNGTAVAWGYNDYGETNVPTGLSNVLGIAAGAHYNLALRNTGTVVAWGAFTNVPSGLSNVVAVSAGWNHNLSLAYSPPPAPPPPTNDNFANATAVTGDGFYVTSSNVSATKEPGEPNHAGNPGGASVWWKWTPTRSGFLRLLETEGSSFDTLVGFYNGNTISNLSPVTSPDGKPAIAAGATYYIAVDGYNGEQGGFGLSLSECIPPRILGFSTSQSTQPDGIHVLICADVDLGDSCYPGSRCEINWSIISGNPIQTNPRFPCFELVLSPTDEEEVNVFLIIGPSECGGGTSGSPPPTSTCGICLSRGAPSLLTGTIGSGTGPQLPTLNCGVLSSNARWYKMIATNETGMVTVSTEGSTNDTLLGIFSGPLTSMVPVACNDNVSSSNHQSRVMFNAVQGKVYWIAVDPRTTNALALRVASGFEPRIESYAIKSDGSFELQSSRAPAIPYRLLTTKNLSSTSDWSVIMTTNLNTNFPYLYYRTTNVQGVPRQLYRIETGP